MMGKLTDHEIKVLRMANGEIPWERGSWVNACVEFLADAGYLHISGAITMKGIAWLMDYDEGLQNDN
jgi:hypothetical protein